MKDPNNALFKQELSKNVEIFLKHISSECREGFDYDDRNPSKQDPSGFPIFGLGDALFYRSRVQEGFLEWRVRDDLVNKSLDFLFKEYNYDIRWRLGKPISVPRNMNEYWNREFEASFPMEFVIVDGEEVSAFRYAPIDADYFILYNLPADMPMLYYQFGIDHIDKWISIDWREENDPDRKKGGYYIDGRQKNPRYISIQQLFVQFFSEQEYKIFIAEVRKAVSLANELLGFQTFSKLNRSNLGLFKHNILEKLKKTDYLSLSYQTVDKDGNILSDRIFDELDEVDKRHILQNFVEKSRYLAIGGKSDFAISFITSEYLNAVFQNELPIDYTSIVSGYIKSVEQLSATIIKEFIIPKYDRRILVPSKRALSKDQKSKLESTNSYKRIGNTDYISLSKDNEAFFKIDKWDLGQMFRFFEKNKEYIFSIDSKNEFSAIYTCMENYRAIDRNGYFHKHNLEEKEAVERIRNNTILLLFWLLGASNLSENEITNRDKLGIVDDTFDFIYRKVAYRYESWYTIKLSNGEGYREAKLLHHSSHVFDEYGYIKNAQLQFATRIKKTKINKENRAPENLDNREIITIDREHLPEEMYITDKEGVTTKLL